MNGHRKIVAFWFVLGLLVWVADTIMDYYAFYKGTGSFLALLITHPPAHEIYIRLVILVCFTAFGVFTSRLVKKLTTASDALLESEQRLRKLSSKLLSVQEKERSGLARDLHDGIGQVFVGVKIAAESALRSVANGENTATSDIDHIIDIAQHGIQEVRSICVGLRPFILDEFGILASINWLCEEFGRVNPACSVVEEIDLEESDIPDSLNTTIFRILQEALNNITKHSRATEVHVMLKRKEGTIELRVQDNGVGVDGSIILDKCRKGLGLLSMRERAELSMGAFSVESRKGGGTVIRVSWPCTP